MKDFVPARIVIEVDGVQASLEHYGRALDGDWDFWECENPKIKKMLDNTTHLLIADRLVEYPCELFLSDWAIQVGKLVAQRWNAKIVSIRPMRPPSEPLDLGDDIIV